jgi:polyisoprenyl-phosphate glycosyltransferase
MVEKKAKKLISVVTACFNEEENIEAVYTEVKAIFKKMSDYRYEHIFIDNSSTDQTVPILKQIAKQDKNVKIIVNTRNFGHIRSPYYALLQATGDAVIPLAADLQEPPALIKEFLAKWEDGYKVVLAVKTGTKDSTAMFAIRRLYYFLIGRLSEVELIKNATGFGLFDQQVVKTFRQVDDPYPYFRGLVAELGFEIAQVEFVQPARKRGITKNNFYTLYDMAMLGITNHSKVPLRIATLIGFATSILSFLVAMVYFIYKLIFWNSFSVGIAPLVIGIFFFSSVQLFFLGIVGEYIGAIYTQVLHRPLIVEKERINF